MGKLTFMHSPQKMINTLFNPLKHLSISAAVMALLTALMAFLYAVSEWIFIFTRPSFLRTVPFTEKLEGLTATSSLLMLAGILAALVIMLPGFILRKRRTVHRIFTALALLIPALILTAAVLLLVDNFTYTLFRFGIVSAKGTWRAVYAVLLVLLAVYLYTRLAEQALTDIQCFIAQLLVLEWDYYLLNIIFLAHPHQAYL